MTSRPRCRQMALGSRSNVRRGTLAAPVLLRAFRKPRAADEHRPRKTRWRAVRGNGSNTESAERPLWSVLFVRGRDRTQGLYIELAPCAAEHWDFESRVRGRRKRRGHCRNDKSKADHPATVAPSCGAASARPERAEKH